MHLFLHRHFCVEEGVGVSHTLPLSFSLWYLLVLSLLFLSLFLSFLFIFHLFVCIVFPLSLFASFVAVTLSVPLYVFYLYLVFKPLCLSCFLFSVSFCKLYVCGVFVQDLERFIYEANNAQPSLMRDWNRLLNVSLVSEKTDFDVIGKMFPNFNYFI